MYKNIVEKSLEIATRAHKGQVRWNKKLDYITHPIEVARIVVERVEKELPITENATDEQKRFREQIIKVLTIVSQNHDVCEDTEEFLDQEDKLVTLLKSEDAFGEIDWIHYEPVIIQALKNLNKHYHKSYLDFVLAAKSNFFSKRVKMADLTHNLSDLTKGSMKEKYELAYYILSN